MQTIRSGRIDEIKSLKIHGKDLIFPQNATYYVLEDESIIKCFLAVKDAKSGVKLQCNYTMPEYRRQGLFSKLLDEVINRYKDKDIYADCLLASRNIYLSKGFTEYKIKEFKHFTIYYMKKEREQWQ